MATLQDIRSKIKAIPHHIRERLFFALVLLLVGLLAFGLGRLSVFYGGSEDFKIIYPNSAEAPDSSQGLPPLVSGGGGYVGAKTGSSYYFPWCTAALHIPESNKVYFDSVASAQAAGYSAGNCKGLK